MVRRIKVGWTDDVKGLSVVRRGLVEMGLGSFRKTWIDLPQALKWFISQSALFFVRSVTKTTEAEDVRGDLAGVISGYVIG